MSAIKKTAKASLYIFSLFVLLFVGGAIYFYVNMGSIAKQLTEQVASDALGVKVTIGNMDISLEQKKVVVSGIRIANPKGYKKTNAITVDTVSVAAESFSKDLLTFSHIAVEGTNVNLEVTGKGTNLGDLKNNVSAKQVSKPAEKSDQSASNHNKEGIKVIVKKFELTKAELHPSVILIEQDLAHIMVPDIHLSGIGQKENGILAEEAIAQIMDVMLQQFNKSAHSSGFLEGLSLEALNAIGVGTLNVFKDNLKKSYENEVEGLKQGLDGLKGLFE